MLLSGVGDGVTVALGVGVGGADVAVAAWVGADVGCVTGVTLGGTPVMIAGGGLVASGMIAGSATMAWPAGAQAPSRSRNASKGRGPAVRLHRIVFRII